MSASRKKPTPPANNKDDTCKIDSSIAKCPHNTNKIYIALTIDDGPRKSVTRKFREFLNCNEIPATWYIVRSNIEEDLGEEYYETLKEMQSEGHEIAIHEAFPAAEKHNTSILSQKMDNPEHINTFPSSNTLYPVFYNNVEDWAAHLVEFKTLLVNKGIKANFLRMPGGIGSQLDSMIIKMGIKNIDRKQMTDYLSKNKVERDKIIRTEKDKSNVDIYKKLNAFAKGIEDSGLKLWGGQSIRNDSLQKSLTNIDGESWTSKIEIRQEKNSDAYDDLTKKVLDRLPRLGRFDSEGKIIKKTRYPYMVILTHDNSKAEFELLKVELKKISDKIIEFTNGKACAEFVTMSRLYELVALNPDRPQ